MIKILAAIAACLTTAFIALPLSAQETPTGTWGATPTWKSVGQQAIDLQQAEAIQAARNGGFHGGTTVNYNGPVSVETTNNGDVTNMTSSTVNAANMTSFSNNVDTTGSTDANVGVNFTSGSTSYNATQNATAGTTQTTTATAHSG